jgi:hypothetical protein
MLFYGRKGIPYVREGLAQKPPAAFHCITRHSHGFSFQYGSLRAIPGI